MIQKLILFTAILTISITVKGQDRITGKAFATRSEVIAQNGMAATSQPLATQVALDILKKGGTAIDAAIAANAMLGLVEPTGNGMGGDLFAIVWDANKKEMTALNASGRSPSSLSLDYFAKNNMTKIPSHGPLPVSVPGCVDGWFELHEKYGKLPMADILQPAIDYAENGFPVTELIAYYMARSVPFLSKYKGFAEVFAPNGKAPTKGEIFKNPALANTFRKIVKGGRDAFYKGDIAKTIGKYMQEEGGFISYDDMANHTSEWVQPVSTNYRGYDVWEIPPNGQGIAALQILNLLEDYNISEMGFGSEAYIHTFTEAKKLAFEDRAKYYADMDFAKVPVKKLISKAYADERRKLINPQKAAKRIDESKLRDGDTIYLTVADDDGNMISLIQSNYRGMGSGMTPPGLGFVLQDRGELFSLNQDMNLQEAGDAPRIQHGGSSQPTGEIMEDGGILYLETGIDYEVIRELSKKGHKIQFNIGGYGGYQAIMWDERNQVYYGASESRKDGQAAGY